MARSWRSSLPNTTTPRSSRHPQHRHRRRASCGGDVHVLVAGANAGGAAQAAAQIAGVAKVLHADGAAASRDGLAENVAAQVLAMRRGLQPHPVPGHRARQERRAARGRQARRGADQRHHQGRSAPTPSSARSTPATRSPPCRASTRSRSSPCAPPASIRRRPAAAAPPVETVPPVADSGKSQLRRPRDRQDRPARADRRQDHRLRRPRAGLERQVQRGADAAGRQARRGAGRQPRRGRCGLCAQRLAGRPDRQDRRAAAVHRLRHLRRDPAPGRHEGQQGHRRDQQGSRGADLQRRRLRPRGRPVHAPCRSWSRRSERAERRPDSGRRRHAALAADLEVRHELPRTRQGHAVRA